MNEFWRERKNSHENFISVKIILKNLTQKLQMTDIILISSKSIKI